MATKEVRNYEYTKSYIIKESKKLEGDLRHISHAHFAASRLFRSLYLWLGIITIVLSTIIGIAVSFKIDNGMTIADYSPWMITTLSGIVALLSGVMTFLSPNDRATMNLNSGNEYDDLRSKVRLFWYVECKENTPVDKLLDRLNNLIEQKGKIKSYAPQIPILAFKLAKINSSRIENNQFIKNPSLGRSYAVK